MPVGRASTGSRSLFSGRPPYTGPVDQGAVDTADGRAPATPPFADPAAPPGTARDRADCGTPLLARDLGLLALVGLLLVAAVWAAVSAISREFYSPTAFVEHYLDLLAEGRAAEALAVPGVAVDSAALEAAGLPATSSQALLRRKHCRPSPTSVAVSETTDRRRDAREGRVPGRAVPRDHNVRRQPCGHRRPRTDLAVRHQSSGGHRPHRQRLDGLRRQRLHTRQAPGVTGRSRRRPCRGGPPPGVLARRLLRRRSTRRSPPPPGVAVLSDSPFTDVPVEIHAAPTAKFLASSSSGSTSSSPAARHRRCCSPPAARSGSSSRTASRRPRNGRSCSSPTVQVVA